jgi:hypothetical protein
LDYDSAAAAQAAYGDSHLGKWQRQAALSQRPHDLAEELKRHVVPQRQRHPHLDEVRERPETHSSTALRSIDVCADESSIEPVWAMAAKAPMTRYWTP